MIGRIPSPGQNSFDKDKFYSYVRFDPARTLERFHPLKEERLSVEGR